jgi:hypothetical protein
MTSKKVALTILDSVFIGFTLTLLLAMIGLPLDLLVDIVDMSSHEFEGFALFVLFGLLSLIHAIASPGSAPRQRGRVSLEKRGPDSPS